MHKFFKFYLKLLAITFLVLINCSWSSPGTLPSTGHSSCEEDIKNLRITSDEYEEYDYSLVLLAEVSNKYLILYMYDKYENFNYKQIDFEYGTASSENALSSIKTKQIRRDVEVLSKSSDGLIKKILIKDFEIPKGKYRKYVINQLSSGDYKDDTKEYLSIAIGTEYTYTTTEDGTLEYKVNAINYVTIQNQVVYHYNVKTDTVRNWGWLEKLGSVGNRYAMLGFSAEQLKINKLQEVEVIYDVYDYSCYVPTDDTQLPNIYNEANIERLKATNEKYKDATDLSFLPEYGEVKTLVEKDVVKVIKPEIIDEDKFNGELFGKKTQNLFWNTIMDYGDIDKYFPEKEYKITNNDMKDKFKDDQYIITFFKSSDKFTYNNNNHGYKFTLHQFDRWISNKLANDFYRFLLRCDTPSQLYATNYVRYFYNYYYFESQEASNACVVRLKYLDIFKGEHDVKVITSPVDSSGNIAGGDETGDDDKNILIAIIILILVILAVCLLAYFLGPVITPLLPQIFMFLKSFFTVLFKVLIKIILYLLQGLYYIIYYTIKGLYYLFKSLFGWIASLFKRNK